MFPGGILGHQPNFKVLHMGLTFSLHPSQFLEVIDISQIQENDAEGPTTNWSLDLWFSAGRHFSPRGYFTKSGDIFLVVTLAFATHIWGTEARGAAKHPPRTASPPKHCVPQIQ